MITKDEVVKELAESKEDNKNLGKMFKESMKLNVRVLDEWKFAMNVSWVLHIVCFLTGIATGIILFGLNI